jgi:hypothetical protein
VQDAYRPPIPGSDQRDQPSGCSRMSTYVLVKGRLKKVVQR